MVKYRWWMVLAVCGVYAISALLVGAGLLKLIDPSQFQAKIVQYDVLDWTTSGLVAVVLPWIEIACGVGLLINRKALWIQFHVVVLFVLFVVVLIHAVVRGLDVSCSCYGDALQLTLLQALCLDVLCLVCLVVHFLGLLASTQKSNG